LVEDTTSPAALNEPSGATVSVLALPGEARRPKRMSATWRIAMISTTSAAASPEVSVESPGAARAGVVRPESARNAPHQARDCRSMVLPSPRQIGRKARIFPNLAPPLLYLVVGDRNVVGAGVGASRLTASNGQNAANAERSCARSVERACARSVSGEAHGVGAVRNRTSR